MNLTTRLVLVYSVLLAICGMVLLFVPEMLLGEIGSDGGAAGAALPMLAQLIGAAMLGFASANWTARSLILGGIYGRAIVVGNQTFAFIAAITILTQTPPSPTPMFWFVLLTIVYGALLFSILMFSPSLLTKSGKAQSSDR